ncbi:hypothetical protein SynWH8103_01747 [Synechococcus sp. WH 8103]|nr:hypothetical protein SynWH8103_01747 [Synechococcus sp. WH 8103]
MAVSCQSDFLGGMRVIRKAHAVQVVTRALPLHKVQTINLVAV